MRDCAAPFPRDCGVECVLMVSRERVNWTEAANELIQEGEEEASPAPEAAAKAEPKKERTPRPDGTGCQAGGSRWTCWPVSSVETGAPPVRIRQMPCSASRQQSTATGADQVASGSHRMQEGLGSWGAIPIYGARFLSSAASFFQCRESCFRTAIECMSREAVNP